MKKNLILFLIFFCTNIIITPTKCAPSLAGAKVDFKQYDITFDNRPYKNLGYHKDNNCERANSTVELEANKQWLYTPAIGNYLAAYKAAEQACTDKTQIYILAPSGISSKEQTQDHQCWEASVTQQNRKWKPCRKLPNCADIQNFSGGNWYSNQNNDKIPVFVNNDGKVIISKNNNLPISLITTSNTFDITCIGYVCTNNNQVLTYGCQDGSCTPGCPNDDSNGGGGGNDPEPERTLPDPPAPPKDPEPDFDNVVKPYLDLLGD